MTLQDHLDRINAALTVRACFDYEDDAREWALMNTATEPAFKASTKLVGDAGRQRRIDIRHGVEAQEVA